MQPDYPAAHSMDTCFFAVDRDGHVACFDTGEAGAVPVQALSGPSDAVYRQLAALPRVDVLYDPQGHSLPGDSVARNTHEGLHLRPPFLMFLAILDPVREEIAAGRAVQVPASAGVSVVFRELNELLVKSLHDSGACLGCHWHFDREDEEEEYGVQDWTTRGLFTYGHLTENWISGPYGRERQPSRPIHVDELPPNVRQAIKAMRFDSLCFADTPHIQPVEHAACESWEAAYVDARYTTIRPIPGKESEYPGAYEFYARNHTELCVEPPPGKEPDSTEK
jgi:hypothetical protein